jgi:hypothetical protein
VCEIEQIRRRKRWSIARAIKSTAEKHPRLGKLNKRGLQARFQVARNFWENTLNRPLVGVSSGLGGIEWRSQRDTKRAAYESALRAFEIALERHRKALETRLSVTESDFT